MKKFTIITGLLFAAIAQYSCSVEEITIPAEQAPARRFHAVLEPTVSEASTKAYANADYKLFWNEGDHLSIFYGNTYNREYEFDGLDGATAGDFVPFGEVSQSSTQQEITTGYDYAVFPYEKKYNMCDTDGNLTVFIKANQEYYDDRLGIGARPLMIARSKDQDSGVLMFKHVGCYIGVRLKGDGVQVASISMRGNDSEPIAGRLKFSFDENGLPVGGFDQQFLSSASETITMTLTDPVALNMDEYRTFWFNLPEITFEKGLVITVTDVNGEAFEIEKNSTLAFSRKHFYRTSATIEFGSTPAPVLYTKTSSIILGGTYLLVDAEDNLAFTGDISGSFASVSPEDGVITDVAGTFAGYEFTLENSGVDYYLKYVDGKYLVNDYRNNGSGNTGLSYVDTRAKVTYPYALTTDGNGAFFFSTTQMGTPTETDQVLYYKLSANYFKIGGGGRGIGVHLYLKDGTGDSPAKQLQTLGFDEETVSWVLGNGYEVGTSYDYPQEVDGAQTGVTYSSDREDVARIEGGMIRIVGAGSATITATAEESEGYFSATASYILRILYPPSEGWKDLETFNLENRALHDYLDAAISSYTDTDDATKTVMEAYANGSAYSDIDRKDCPNPVKITWANPASDATVVSIYEDDSLYKPIWSQHATERSTSADVYNLIPGRKYYYTVSEGATVWEKGYFNTTGRRRLIKVSDVEAKGHANNCRDLGGLEVWDEEDGVKKTIKYGYLFRGTNMDKTTESEQDILTGFLNIGMDVDLRYGSSSVPGQNEQGNQTCYRPLPSYVGYVNPSFNSFTDLTTAGKVRNIIMAIFETVLQPEEDRKAVYFHCWVGADRTGYFAMMIEGLLGVSEKDCSIDYELTSFSDAVDERRYRTGAPKDYYFRQGIEYLRSKGGDTFQEKIQNYLVNEVGIDAAAIKAFKEAVLENVNQ